MEDSFAKKFRGWILTWMVAGVAMYIAVETLTQVLQRGYMWVITPTTQGTMLRMSANLNHGYTMLASLHTFH